MFCEDCPRREEPEGISREDVRGKFSSSRGPVGAPVVIVGIAPGKDELLLGTAFVGASGGLLDQALRLGGSRLDEVRCINLINCFPLGANEVPVPDQLRACSGRLLRELEQANQALVVVPLGTVPFQTLTGSDGTISKWRGYPEKHIVGGMERWVVPTFHPAFVMRQGLGPAPYFRSDIAKALQCAKGEYRPLVDPGECPLPSAPAVLAFDIETAGFHGDIRRLSLGWTAGATSLVWGLRTVASVKPLLTGSSLKVAHNMTFDMPRLEANGMPVAGPYWDTLLAAQLIDPDAPNYGLNDIASFYLDVDRWKHKGNATDRPRRLKYQSWKKGTPCEKCQAGVTYGHRVGKIRTCFNCCERAFADSTANYGVEEETYSRRDSLWLVEIQRLQELELRRTGMLDLFRHMMTVLPILIRMHVDGLRVDGSYRDRIAKRFGRWAHWAEANWLASSGGIPVGSHKRIMDLLFTIWALPKQFKEEKANGKRVLKLTADEEALRTLLQQTTGEHKKAIRCLLWARHYQKWVSTYTRISDRVHPIYAPSGKEEDGVRKFSAGANSGRIIAKGNTDFGRLTPPIQQIPKPLRRLFIPADGSLYVEADYGSQELRIAAYYFNDRKLIEHIESGFDIHAANATRWKCDRTRAKNGFYGSIYGASGRAVQRAMKAKGYMMSLVECDALVADMRRLYPDLFSAHKELLARVKRDKFLSNPFGRRRYFWNPDKSYNEILNYPIQSTGADILWRVLPQVEMTCASFKGRLRVVVHDSVLCEVPVERQTEFIPKLREVLEQEFPEVASGFRVPVDIKAGTSWGTLT